MSINRQRHQRKSAQLLRLLFVVLFLLMGSAKSATAAPPVKLSGSLASVSFGLPQPTPLARAVFIAERTLGSNVFELYSASLLGESPALLSGGLQVPGGASRDVSH